MPFDMTLYFQLASLPWILGWTKCVALANGMLTYDARRGLSCAWQLGLFSVTSVMAIGGGCASQPGKEDKCHLEEIQTT